MRKFLCMFSLLLLCAYSGRINAQTESTSSATITFFRTPSSLLPGRFSVSGDKEVAFSRGNLQYLASKGIWRFAEHQWDVVGNNAGNTTISGRDSQGYWIDLFAWGTSGHAVASRYYEPWRTTTTANKYGPTLSDMAAEASWADNEATKIYDWGIKNFKGPNEGYRVLANEEWRYIFYTRTNAADLYGLGSLYGKYGLFLLPDNWDWADVATQTEALGFVWTAAANKDFFHNIIPNTTEGKALWNAMEVKGAVFLPCGGARTYGTSTVNNEVNALYYWSSTAATADNAYCVRFFNGEFTPNIARARSYGFSVRLVQEFGK